MAPRPDLTEEIKARVLGMVKAARFTGGNSGGPDELEVAAAVLSGSA